MPSRSDRQILMAASLRAGKCIGWLAERPTVKWGKAGIELSADIKMRRGHVQKAPREGTRVLVLLRFKRAGIRPPMPDTASHHTSLTYRAYVPVKKHFIFWKLIIVVRHLSPKYSKQTCILFHLRACDDNLFARNQKV